MKRRIQLILVWLALIGGWEAAYRIVEWKSWKFPAPSHVVDSTMSMLAIQTHFGEPLHEGWPWTRADGTVEQAGSATLLKAIGISGVRLTVGFGISIVFGLLIGMAMWRWGFLDSLLGPLFLGLQTLPSVCWVPLAVLVLGINEPAIMMVLILGSCFAVALSLRDGLRTIPPIYQRAGEMLAADGYRMYRYVLLPASLPAMASSLRQGFSFAWRSLMGAELIFPSVSQGWFDMFRFGHKGVGHVLSIGREFADVAQVVAVMIVMIVIGMAVDRLVFARLERAVRHRFGLDADR